MKTRRPTISPNINFVGQLLELDLLLFGNGGFCGSPPPGPLSSREPEGSGGGPLLPKSSSSPCMDALDELNFPFHRNRSLPSLRPQRPVGEAGDHCRRQSLLSPPSELASLGPNLLAVGGERSPRASAPAPAPVFHEPGSAEYSAALALCLDRSLDGPRGWGDEKGASDAPEDGAPAITAPTDSVGKPPKESESPGEGAEDGGRGRGRAGPHLLQHSKPFLFPPAAAKKALGSEDGVSPQPEAPPVSFPPKTPAGGKGHPSSPSPRKGDPPYLPRSHSSSETYLNRRTRLERQAASNPGGANTRKSFSSDEVGRGFQQVRPLFHAISV